MTVYRIEMVYFVFRNKTWAITEQQPDIALNAPYTSSTRRIRPMKFQDASKAFSSGHWLGY